MLKHSVQDGTIFIETDKLHARIRTTGYVSGVGAGSLVDKDTTAVELGFGLQIADFLLEPGTPGEEVAEDQYQYGSALPEHGKLAKRYVEGPQICTKAEKLEFELIAGDGFVAVKQWFTFNKAYDKYKPGSKWEQILIFPENTRYYLGADRITSANDCPNLFFRQDLPGHIKHTAGSTFEHVYLSYAESMLPSTDFLSDFAPDDNYLYQRAPGAVPPRMIRAYQVLKEGAPGPWLAGMTLQPEDVYEAWCHQRNYVCMIQEIGGRAVKAGDTFGAAYVVGWFSGIRDMEGTYDKYKGASGWELTGPADKPTGYAPVKQADLKPVKR